VPEYTLLAILITMTINFAQVAIDKIIKKFRFYK